jgi:RNA polymerase sigma-70 factor, ECF subfamily
METPMATQRKPVSADVTALTDEDLVRLALERNGAAFRMIIQKYNRRLYRIARSVLRSDSEAEDALQDGYLRAFANLAQFRGASSLSTWLSRIVLNEALGRIRRRKPTVELSAIEGGAGHMAEIIPFPSITSQMDPERSMAQRQIHHIVERAIDHLPLDFRTVLVARLVQEMSIEETAELLHLRPETVKTRLHRARGLLKAELEKSIGAAMTDAFPFDGQRCERITANVLRKLALPA